MNGRRPRRIGTAFVFASLSLAAGCAPDPTAGGAGPGLADREAIEEVLKRANVGFELSELELFASAFAEDGVYELVGDGPVFGYDKMLYTGRDEIRTIITGPSGAVRECRSREPGLRSLHSAKV